MSETTFTEPLLRLLETATRNMNADRSIAIDPDSPQPKVHAMLSVGQAVLMGASLISTEIKLLRLTIEKQQAHEE